MISLKLFLVIYLFGGITFIPLVIYTFFYLSQKLEVIEQKQGTDDDGLLVSGIDSEFKAGKLEESKGVEVRKTGWITITTRYYYHSTELINNEVALNDDQILQRSQLKKKHRFFTHLKHGNLFLYKEELHDSEIIHAISLKDMFVTIWPRLDHNDKSILSDASLFTKRTCISIIKKNLLTLNKANQLEFINQNSETTENEVANIINDTITSKQNQFFLYFENNMDKEDWYFELVNASKMNFSDSSRLNPVVSAETAHFTTVNMLSLIQMLNSTEGQLTTKWLNALIGRLFLSLQQTDKLNQIIFDKIYKKLTKINKPGFLDDFVIQKVDVGNSAPFITNPQLQQLSTNGETKLSLDLLYSGDLSLIISTKVNINLGSHFKPKEVSIQLSIKVKKLEGNMVVLIKPPPSNRIWYAFTTEPFLDLEIEPVVSSNKLSYNVITNAIKSKFAEAIKESLVVPYMDDIVFFSTEGDLYRGGIWNRTNVTESKSDGDVSDNITEKTQDLSSTDTDSTYPVDNTKNESFRKSFRGNSKRSSQATINSVDSNSQTSDSSTNGPKKRYFKNSIKKINKWYKDNVNSTTNDNDKLDDSDDSDIDEVIEPKNTGATATEVEQPRMISNRRSIPKKMSSISSSGSVRESNESDQPNPFVKISDNKNF
ncbi:hypothetical protein KAFR_0H00720 [Kazachstania africana CBS 2517]|uniref:SMP-LTD domain-containing protein n=1 Tax=Kazachstania africana (strain ATCC 22294 / BCRC 22015 / CBS 2517 / CECT 1963 / NBRC 1671 / NRRL Y-8276) TaxID=1071382 RepID=H2AYS5_KAZAF|nr:hypothetical protein KAFR_0H00720 [Kazachstania africana CBS 2517]CCF59481.1 hypothetical protein KAFR_0H00720 [Kazachstania africana CBS 2517]